MLGRSQGAHEIHSFCLGHKAFVTSVAFVQGDKGAVCIVTASGDGSVRSVLAPFHCTLSTTDGALVPALVQRLLSHTTIENAHRLWNHLTGEQLAEVQLTHPPDNSDAAAADDAAGEPLADSGAAVPAEQAGAAADSGGQPADADAASAPEAAAAEQQGGAAEPAFGAGQQPDAAYQAARADAEAEEANEEEPGARTPLCPAITTLAVSPNK